MRKIIQIISMSLCLFYLRVFAFEIQDYSKVYVGSVAKIVQVHSVDQLRNVLISRPAYEKVSIAGGQYSMGGQTWYPDGLVIDMKGLKSVIYLDIAQKIITVQAGALWKDVQEFLHPCGLTVKVMQSYNNFSVGGSLSVNVHGRDPYGSLIETVDSFRIMLADGSIVHASRHEKQDLFSAVLGGYGACGIIVDVTLHLEDNYKIKRNVTSVSVEQFRDFYMRSVAADPDLVFFNGNLYPPHFDTVVAFCWQKTSEPLTITDLARSNKSGFLKNAVRKNLEFSAVVAPSTQSLRRSQEVGLSQETEVVWRSYEMSHSIESLAPHWAYASKILQEYFVPVDSFESFVANMREVLQKHKAKILNISIRHVKPNTESILAYAPVECFAFVFYIVLMRTPGDIEATTQWTQELIDVVLRYGGTFYLPYHRFSRPDQVHRAYPRLRDFLNIKDRYDPCGIFQNNLLSMFCSIS